MPNAFSDLLAALAEAPGTQIDEAVTARLKEMAEADAAPSDGMKAVLDDCAHGSLASDFAMRAMREVWLRMREAEGLPDPYAEERARAESAAAEYRAEAMKVTAADVEAALHAPGADDKAAGSKDLVAMFKAANALLATGRFGEFDAVLAALRPDALSPTMAVGVLRYSFAARERLPSWPSARDRIHASLAPRVERIDRVMMGLLDR